MTKPKRMRRRRETPAAARPEQRWRCANCDTDWTDEEPGSLRECSSDQCGSTFVAEFGENNCDSCGRPFTRNLADHACADCQEEMEESEGFPCENPACPTGQWHDVPEPEPVDTDLPEWNLPADASEEQEKAYNRRVRKEETRRQREAEAAALKASLECRAAPAEIVAIEGEKFVNIEIEVTSGATEIARPFVEKIEAAHVKSVEAVMSLADTLIEARKVLKPRGLFYRIFSDAKDPLPGCSVSMSSSTADKITSIRERKALSDPSTWKGLPTSWTTLYELTRLSVAEVRRLVKQGEITPDLSVKEARSLVLDLYPSDKPAAPKPKPATPRVEPAEQEPDWRLHLDVDTVELGSPEQVALLVQQHGGLMPSTELHRFDIPLTFIRSDGTSLDKLSQYIAEAQHRDQREVADKIIEALNRRHRIYRADEPQAAEHPLVIEATAEEPGPAVDNLDLVFDALESAVRALEQHPRPLTQARVEILEALWDRISVVLEHYGVLERSGGAGKAA